MPFPIPGDLPHPGIESEAPALASGFSIIEPPGKSPCGGWRKLIEEKKEERESSFCTGATKLCASSWDACAETVASSPEGGGVGPVTSRGHQGDICASPVGGLLNQS